MNLLQKRMNLLQKRVAMVVIIYILCGGKNCDILNIENENKMGSNTQLPSQP